MVVKTLMMMILMKILLSLVIKTLKMGQVEINKQFEAEMNNNIKSFNLQKTKILKTL